jgi:hypothetical protein
MYDLLGPVQINGIFFSIILMSVHNSEKFQQCSVIFAKFAVHTKICLFFRNRGLFFADTYDKEQINFFYCKDLLYAYMPKLNI